MAKFDNVFVLDTNVLVAAVSPKSPYYYIWERFLNRDFRLAVSTATGLEYQEILTRFYGSKYAKESLSVLEHYTTVVWADPRYALRLIPNDPDDDKFVDLAFATNATAIVTNDHHFNVLSRTPFPPIPTMTIDEFMTFLKREDR